MLSGRGHLTEGASCNVFFLREGRLCTPSLATGILSGVTRARILNVYAPAVGVPVEEGQYGPEALASAAEVFLCSTLRGVMPVGWIDDRRLQEPVPGPITRQLMALIREELGEPAVAW
jgi:branched-subunit amino acid aminotransferase/4-amino-4-deoxychorismate lyase